MTATPDALEGLLARFVEHHVATGEQLDLDGLCADRPALAPALRALVERYLSLDATLDADPLKAPAAPAAPAALPEFDGFDTIERIGAGGMGDVYKLRDLTLDRLVAAKVIRTRDDAGVRSRLGAFLREARALALFSDRRIVQIHEARLDHDPPVLIMEFVEGFELGAVARALDVAQRARICASICDAVHHAHTLGLQHRDLKPSNIMLDASLTPRILDFGLAAADPARGHFVGTPPYLAPEQLDPFRPIDARADIYAMGVILYEMLCGRQPSRARPALPVELDPSVPEPLQAIALTAMEQDPGQRYATALDMAADLRRWLEGGRVTARPSLYATTLGARVQPHLGEIREWLRLRLVHRHEAERLEAAYGALDARDDDWIVESRLLSYTQIALYLGAFLLVAGSLFYFVAARWYETVQGVAGPFVVLALPFAGLNAAAHLLYRRDHKAVAIAFLLGAAALLPLFLLIVLHEARWLAASDFEEQLFDRAVSNQQFQLTTLLAAAWAGFLAVRTRTAALSAMFTLLAGLFVIGVTADFGLRGAIEDGRWDMVALRLLPLAVVHGALGYGFERARRAWLSRPLYLAAVVVFVLVMELLALDGRLLQHLGLTLAAWQRPDVSDPTLLDTIAAMTMNGALFYGAASLLLRHGSAGAVPAAHLLVVIAPFALLHPLGYLVRQGDYSARFDWVYAACALAIMLLSQRRQRRSFYYAGLLNLGAALFFIAEHRTWFDRPGWGIGVIGAGLLVLTAGFLLDRAQRR